MLIEPKYLARYWRLNPQVVIHVGAHEAEELRLYEEACWGARQTIWVEALPEKVAYLRESLSGKANQSVVEALAWSESGKLVSFTETSNSQSSSALPLGEHAALYPEIKGVRRHDFRSARLVDVIDFSQYAPIGLLSLDIQGAELEALKGAAEALQQVEAVYCEVNLVEIYRGNPLMNELCEYLRGFGFVLADYEILPDGWGDALWLRREQLPPLARLRRWLRRVDQRVTNSAADLGRRIVIR